MENVNSTSTYTQPSWFPVALRYGIITGLVAGVVSILLFITGGFEKVWIGFIIGVVIQIGSIVFAHKDFKSQNNGFMTYGRGLLIGTILSAISGLVGGLISFAYIQFVDMSVIDRMNELQIVMMEKFGLPEDKMDEAIQKLEESNTPAKQITGGLTTGLTMGFLFSLIVSAITKKNKPEFE
ncbi:DUF4199 domain-containing protein [Adhaeribacter swui]|uniref:DUF4199 domain-containing protein n=1 Tax=Adhaeribacter swui TaxID=2086471 RepID=A0A7G7GBS2_9BACT|nr:DUF4199 domain-containing protein [Adhaeribacter swui]QNF34606.1 DUF4199 domain-containing protein [Adhaeribacter swui]